MCNINGSLHLLIVLKIYYAVVSVTCAYEMLKRLFQFKMIILDIICEFWLAGPNYVLLNLGEYLKNVILQCIIKRFH